MTTHVHTPATLALPRPIRHLAWFAGGSAVAFLIPYLGVSVLDLQHDVYYGAYFTITLAMLGAYARVERIDLHHLFTHNWKWSVALGVPTAAFVMWNVFRTDAGTARPHGAYFAFEVLWRGIGYGTVDALLLTVFPCVVAYNVLRGRLTGWRGHLRYMALALPLIWLVTATYHLGYPQVRQDGLQKPEIGNTIISVPMLATMNPIGSIGAHAAYHVTAVTHAYETRNFLPPETFVSSK